MDRKACARARRVAAKPLYARSTLQLYETRAGCGARTQPLRDPALSDETQLIDGGDPWQGSAPWKLIKAAACVVPFGTRAMAHPSARTCAFVRNVSVKLAL